MISTDQRTQFLEKVLPAAVVAVLFDVTVKWHPRTWILDRIREELGGGEPVLVFPRSLGSTSLESVTIFEGADSVVESDLPVGGELGWIPYPDFSDVEDGGMDALRAMVSRGSMWSKEMQLIW